MSNTTIHRVLYVVGTAAGVNTDTRQGEVLLLHGGRRAKEGVQRERLAHDLACKV